MTPELLAMIKDVKPATDEEIDAWLEGKNLIRYAAVMSLISRIVAERKAVIAECAKLCEPDIDAHIDDDYSEGRHDAADSIRDSVLALSALESKS